MITKNLINEEGVNVMEALTEEEVELLKADPEKKRAMDGANMIVTIYQQSDNITE
jgi:hypothetical protein